MSFDISVAGRPFTRWKTARVSRSIDTNCGIFSFTNSAADIVSEYPVREGDAVVITVSGSPIITGYVDNVSGSHSATTHDISVAGRDNVQDLIDSSVPDAAKVTAGPVSMATLCERVVTALGVTIPVQVASGLTIADFTSEDLQAAGAGESCMAHLVSFARKRQVYLLSDGKGSLVIYRPDRANRATTPILHTLDHGGNVIECSFRRAMELRFNLYRCRSQDNFGFDETADYTTGAGCDRKGTATDSNIRVSRYLELQAEQSMQDADCQQRANEEANMRRTSALNYACTIPGVTQSDGTVWDVGQIVTLQDDYASISGEFLIKTVELTVDISGGTLTRLELVLPDAYQVTAEQSAADKRKARVK